MFHFLLLLYLITLNFPLVAGEFNFIKAETTNKIKKEEFFFKTNECDYILQGNYATIAQCSKDGKEISFFSYNDQNCTNDHLVSNTTISTGEAFATYSSITCELEESLELTNSFGSDYYVEITFFANTSISSCDEAKESDKRARDYYRLNRCIGILQSEENLEVSIFYIYVEANSSKLIRHLYADPNCETRVITSVYDDYLSMECFAFDSYIGSFKLDTLKNFSNQFNDYDIIESPLKNTNDKFGVFTLHYSDQCDNELDRSYVAKSLFLLNTCQNYTTTNEQIIYQTFANGKNFLRYYYSSENCNFQDLLYITLTRHDFSSCTKITNEEGFGNSFFHGHNTLCKDKYFTLDLSENYPEAMQDLPTVYPQECGEKKSQGFSSTLMYYNTDFCISEESDNSIQTIDSSYKGYCNEKGILTMKKYQGNDCNGHFVEANTTELCISDGKAFFDCSFRVCNNFFAYDTENVCNGHGECTEYNVCDCHYGYDGDYCQNNILGNVIIVLSIIGSVFLIVLIILFILIVIIVIFWFNIQKYRKLEDIDLLLDEQRLNKEGKAANIKINRELFKVDYSNIRILKKIGEGGGGGAIFLSEYHGTKVAFKAFNTDDICSDQSNFDEFEREVEVLGNVKHPHILNFLGAVIHPPRVGILMEYCKNGDLKTFLTKNKNYEFTKKLKFIQQISSACSYLHEKNIIHRDMKSLNILVDDSENLKIMDFGLSKVVHEILAEKTKGIGTSCYMAPEVAKGGKYDEKCDVFSTGIIFWEIFNQNFKPFGNSSYYGIERKIAENPEMRPNIEKEKFNNEEWLIELIKNMWSHDPSKRLGFSEILEEIKKHENQKIKQ